MCDRYPGCPEIVTEFVSSMELHAQASHRRAGRAIPCETQILSLSGQPGYISLSSEHQIVTEFLGVLPEILGVLLFLAALQLTISCSVVDFCTGVLWCLLLPFLFVLLVFALLMHPLLQFCIWRSFCGGFGWHFFCISRLPEIL